MLIRRRHLLAAAGASALGRPGDPPPAIAQAKQINLAGASYDMRDAILGEFAKRTGITPGPSSIPRPRSRVDRLRTAPVDCVLLDAPFAAYANSEKLLQPIDISRAAQLGQAASAAEGRPRHADRAAGLSAPIPAA